MKLATSIYGLAAFALTTSVCNACCQFTLVLHRQAQVINKEHGIIV